MPYAGSSSERRGAAAVASSGHDQGQGRTTRYDPNNSLSSDLFSECSGPIAGRGFGCPAALQSEASPTLGVPASTTPLVMNAMPEDDSNYGLATAMKLGLFASTAHSAEASSCSFVYSNADSMRAKPPTQQPTAARKARCSGDTNAIFPYRPSENCSPALNSSLEQPSPILHGPPPMPTPTTSSSAMSFSGHSTHHSTSMLPMAAPQVAADSPTNAGVASQAVLQADDTVPSSLTEAQWDPSATSVSVATCSTLAIDSGASLAQANSQQRYSPSRSPAMYGVVGLPFTSTLTAAVPPASCEAADNGEAPSRSRAPAMVRARMSHAQSTQNSSGASQKHEQPPQKQRWKLVQPTVVSDPHVAKSNDFAAQYRATIVRVGGGSMSGDSEVEAQLKGASSPRVACKAAPVAKTSPSPFPIHATSLKKDTPDPHPSPRTVVAARKQVTISPPYESEPLGANTTNPVVAQPGSPRGRKDSSRDASDAVATGSSRPVRASGESTQVTSGSGVFAAPPAPLQYRAGPSPVVVHRRTRAFSSAMGEEKSTASPSSPTYSKVQLTADTVLPVASRDDKRRQSSSSVATDATQRSSISFHQSGFSPKLNTIATIATTPTRDVVKKSPNSPDLRCTPPVAQASSAPAAASPNGKEVAEPSPLPAPVLSRCRLVRSRGALQRFVDLWCCDDKESDAAYKEGGYITVKPGAVVHSRYVMLQKLGWGQFSTVWLAYDARYATQGRGPHEAFVAIKVTKCHQRVLEISQYEVSLLRYMEARLPKRASVSTILNCFDTTGDYGSHMCMTMPLWGPNLLCVIDHMRRHQRRRSPNEVLLIKEIVASVLVSLYELSQLNILHTDIKPENVLAASPDTKTLSLMENFCRRNSERKHMLSVSEFRSHFTRGTPNHLICLADFGLSALLEPPTVATSSVFNCRCPDVSLLAPLVRCKRDFPVVQSGVMSNVGGTLIQTREYRAPEVLLGLDFTCATDVWSVGCMTYELITGNFLMNPKRKGWPENLVDVEHMWMMSQLIGPLPQELIDLRVQNNGYYDQRSSGRRPSLSRGSRPPPEYLHRFIDSHGNVIHPTHSSARSRRQLETELELYLGEMEAMITANFIYNCLYCYDPKRRPSARKMLSHIWFRGVGTLPKEEKAAATHAAS